MLVFRKIETKNLIKTIFASAVVAVAIVACEKEEVKKETTEVEVEENNRMLMDIDAVPLGPDLVVTFVNSNLPVVNPSACGGRAQQTACGSQYTLEVHVTNIGNAPTTDYYEILMDKPTGNTTQVYRTSPTNSLAPGATDVFLIGPAPFGGCSGVFSTQELILTCDVYNSIRETNESNNTARAYKYCGD